MMRTIKRLARELMGCRFNVAYLVAWYIRDAHNKATGTGITSESEALVIDKDEVWEGGDL